MKPSNQQVSNTLDELLGQHKDPSDDRVSAALDRIRAGLRSKVPEAAFTLATRPAVEPAGWTFKTSLVTAAAVLVLVIAMLARFEFVRNGSAVVEAVDGTLYRLSGTEAVAIRGGDEIDLGDPLRTNGGAGAQLRLSDDSRIEMRSQSELSFERAGDGLKIRLTRGSIIVNAAKRSGGHLYVETRDMTVSVVGTVFMVNAEETGTRVAVLEGEVRVKDAKTETKLRTGEYVSTSPTLASRSVTEDLSWSREATTHRARLEQQPVGAQEKPGARSRFEVAAIRPCSQENPGPPGGRGGGANSLVMTSGRFYMECMTLATIIRTAYGYGPMGLEVLNSSENPRAPGPGNNMRFGAVYGLGTENGQRVRGGPDWVRSERYTIEATTDGAIDTDTMKGPMLQELLERRFQVKVHVEAEQVPAYALTVAPGGFKIKPMQEGDCTREPVSEAVKAERERTGMTGPILITEAARLGVKPTCGTMYGEQNGPNFRMEHVAQAPGGVALFVGTALQMRVIDRTGITEKFIYAWEYGPDESTPGAERWRFAERTRITPGFDAPPTAPKAPPIFTALLQQLGLKLEPIRVPREYLVVDRVARPSPNSP